MRINEHTGNVFFFFVEITTENHQKWWWSNNSNVKWKEANWEVKVILKYWGSLKVVYKRRERFNATCAHDDPNSTDVTEGGSRQLKAKNPTPHWKTFFWRCPLFSAWWSGVPNPVGYIAFFLFSFNWFLFTKLTFVHLLQTTGTFLNKF